MKNLNLNLLFINKTKQTYNFIYVFLQESAIDEVRAEVEELNQNKIPKRYIGEYAIYDVLGTGAFGCVYRVRTEKTKKMLIVIQTLIFYCLFNRFLHYPLLLPLIIWYRRYTRHYNVIPKSYDKAWEHIYVALANYLLKLETKT